MKESLKMTKVRRGSKGITLVELMVALVISAILIGALHQTFIRQQKVYHIQEQVVDMQQNARLAIKKMIRDVRMAGGGNLGPALSHMGLTGAFTMDPDKITVYGAYRELRDPDTNEPITVTESAGNMITLSHSTDEFDNYDYLCIGGLFSYVIQGPKPRGEVSVLTLDRKPQDPKGEYIYKVEKFIYDLDTLKTHADGIEGVGLGYLDENGAPTATAGNVRIVNLTVTAKTKDADPDYKGVDGYRRRVFRSNIQLRNVGTGLP
jgi:prepilin-type N-terminal cleavage/methylation domain-containing protein